MKRASFFPREEKAPITTNHHVNADEHIKAIMSSTRRHNKAPPARLAIHLTVVISLFSSNALFGSAFLANHRRVTNNILHKRHSSPLYSSYRQNDSSSSHGYILEPNAGPIHPKCRLTENQIHILISKRQRCKRQRQYDDADKILAALNQCGVFLHDKRNEWRADGKNHFGRRSDYVRRGSTYGLLSEEDISAVSTMVEDRSYAKKRGEFHISDKLGDILKTKYRVKVDDKNREWSVENIVEEDENGKVVIGGDYVPSPLCKLDGPTHTMDEESKTLIAQRLAERTLCRKKRDYAMADKILDEVMAQYSVVVDDRTKEWKVVLGDDFEDDDFVKGALLSQRSAFVRGGKKTTEELNKTSAISERDEDSTTSTVNEEEVIASANQNALDFDSMTVVELKEQLRQAGLPVSGKKADLILRLNQP
jgi:hypothetical protein